jgi:hypothetical protein
VGPHGSQWIAAAHVESAVHADRHLPGHVGTLTGLAENGGSDQWTLTIY